MFCIFTDTSANLSGEVLAARKIETVSFTYTKDGVEYSADAKNFDGHAFYEAMREGTRVQTAQIPPQESTGLNASRQTMKKGNA